jgi:hypothetical protein
MAREDDRVRENTARTAAQHTATITQVSNSAIVRHLFTLIVALGYTILAVP